MDTGNGQDFFVQPFAAYRFLKTTFFVGGIFLGSLIVGALWLVFSSSVDSFVAEVPAATAELEYAMYSTRTGESGGSVIPASCESGYEHYAGECAGWGGPLPSPVITLLQCLNNGTQVNIGWSGVAGAWRYLPRFAGADGWCGAYPGWWYGYGSCNHDSYGANSAILNLTPGGWHRFWVHAGDPISDPPANTGNFLCPQTPAIGYACINNGTAVSLWWSAMSGAATYWPRLSGMTPAQCAAIGWTMWIDGTTCYTNNYNATSAILPLNPGATHRAWVHSVSYGDIFSFYSEEGVTPYFNCPTQQVPIGWLDGASCGAAVNSGVVSGWVCDPDSWASPVTVHIYRDGPAGVGVYVGQVVANQNRVDVAPHCGGTTAHGYTFTIPESLRDNVQHTYYVHGIDVAPGGGSGGAGNPVLQGGGAAATCSVPPPTGASVSCNVAGTQATMNWTAPSGYNTFYTRVTTSGPVVGTNPLAGGWDDNFVGTSNTFTVTPGVTYYWWLHTKNAANGAYSNYIPQPTGGTFTCTAPVGPVAPTLYLTATNIATGVSSPTSINITTGQNIRIDWSSTNATACSNIAGPSDFSTGNLPNGNDTSVTAPFPGSSTVFTVRCTSASGLTDTKSVTVVNTSAALVPPTLSLNAVNTTVRQGQSANLNWSISANYALNCTVTGGGASQLISFSAPSGSGTVTTPVLNNSQNFTLTCENTALGIAPVSDTARVDVIPNQQEI
jgi:hypothetical protein